MLANGTQAIMWGLVGTKALQPILLQNFPRSTGWRRISYLPTSPFGQGLRPPKSSENSKVQTVNALIPPNLGDTLPQYCGLCSALLLPIDRNKIAPNAFNKPRVVHAIKPLPTTFFTLSGVTRNINGVATGLCTVDLYNTLTDVKIDSTVSDVSGNFVFKSPLRAPTAYYIVAFKSGSPDIFGTTVNTLTAV